MDVKNLNMTRNLLTLVLTIAISSAVTAETFNVAEGGSIQSAIDGAADGDTINVAAGTFNEDINFNGKNVSVIGAGDTTIIQGTGTGSVVTFTNGETANATLDSVTVTGGVAVEGGGILITNSSPTIIRTNVIRNKAQGNGSGIFISGTSAAPLISNSRIVRNSVAAGGDDPHGVQIAGSSPVIVNNTIAFNDSNGIFITGSTSQGTIQNNIISNNGTRRRGKAVKGRGICEFAGSTTIQFNLFFKNVKSAFLGSTFKDFGRIKKAQRVLGLDRINNNRDGNPRFKRARRNNYTLRRRSKARNKGNPADEFLDGDGTRNDMGFTGGPSAG